LGDSLFVRLSKSYVERYVEGMIKAKKEISLREAVNRVEARLSQEGGSKYKEYKDEYFKGRLRLSKAIKREEDWYKNDYYKK